MNRYPDLGWRTPTSEDRGPIDWPEYRDISGGTGRWPIGVTIMCAIGEAGGGPCATVITV